VKNIAPTGALEGEREELGGDSMQKKKKGEKKQTQPLASSLF